MAKGRKTSGRGKAETRPKAPAPKSARKVGAGGVRVRRKTPLSKKELTEFREMLLEKRRLLLGDLTGMEAETAVEKGKGNLSTMPTHMADVGTDNFEHEFTLGLLESEQALLREIDEALARIQEGTYGICLGTREPIPKARLRAKPWAKYTIEYTRMLEKGLAQPAGEDQPQSEDDEAEEPEEPAAPEPEEPEDEAPEEIEEEQE